VEDSSDAIGVGAKATAHKVSGPARDMGRKCIKEKLKEKYEK
jgi:hypothetical protein